MSQSDFESPLVPVEVADAPDIENVPVAEGLHTLTKTVLDMYQMLREIRDGLTAQHPKIAAPVPAERPDGGSGGSRTLGDRLRAAADYQDRPGAYDELRAMAAMADHLATQADRAHKAVHDTLRWVEGKERDARRASDKANEQVYQQVARMLRRAFDRAGTAETGETTNA